MSKTSDPVYIFLAFFVLIEFIGVVIVNTIGSLPVDPGWFLNTTGDLSDKYAISITPAGWAFSIWGVIYIWQAIWIIYVIVNIFRTNKFGKVYLNPSIVPPALLAIYAVNLVLNVTWLFTWDRQYLIVSLVVLALIAFTNYVCVIINLRAVDKHIEQLCKDHRVDLWLNSFFITNGILVYATWTTIATLLNLSTVLTYSADLEEEVASLICLSILTVELVLYFVVDIFLLERHLRSAFMVYPVVIMASISALFNNWDPNRSVSIFTAVIVGLACAALVGKVIKGLTCCCRKDQTTVANSDKMPMQDVA
ncbi:uncharacterized protein LOC575154 [Strongylocentrotus purpuratus]|uniref:Uncharacterized protein n=1 Tax=Strongylocentrotus purpuratus TaxID=7668 RepID=A0A7M7TG24_STRPU|nr:uncharacterized protein LOC575154 [Strongylocentrotus purpuratus]XP_780664.2 uncharacterized protein LOC575154 [Strongylocentrotus purpuratus]